VSAAHYRSTQIFPESEQVFVRQALTVLVLDANYSHVRIISNKTFQGNSSVRDLDEQRKYFVSRCRERGVRVTAQRMAVFEALARDVSHPGADSLYAELRKTMPTMSLSTVYRILESLENEGLIRRVSATSGSARYDGNLVPHQHLVCRCCGSITDFEDASLSRFRLPGGEYNGFIAEEFDVRVVGTCPDCRRSAPGGSMKTIDGSRLVSRKEEEN
jgi:Fur family transcriptional regulator, peroxide stress response regulator